MSEETTIYPISGVDNKGRKFTEDSAPYKREIAQFPELTREAAMGNVIMRSNRGEYDAELDGIKAEVPVEATPESSESANEEVLEPTSDVPESPEAVGEGDKTE